MPPNILAQVLGMFSGPDAVVVRGFAERFLTDTEVDLGIIRSTQALCDSSTVRNRRHLPGGGFAEQEITLVPLCNLGPVNVGLVIVRGRRAGSGSDWWSARETKSSWNHFIGRYFRNEASGEMLYVLSDAGGTGAASESPVVLNWVGPPSGNTGLDRETINVQLDSKAWARALVLTRGEGDTARFNKFASDGDGDIGVYERSVRRQSSRQSLVLPAGPRDFRGCQVNLKSYCGVTTVRAVVAKNPREHLGTASTFESTVDVLSGTDAESTRRLLLTFGWCNRKARQKICPGLRPNKGREDVSSADLKTECGFSLALQGVQNCLACTDILSVNANRMHLKRNLDAGESSGLCDGPLGKSADERWSGPVGGDVGDRSPFFEPSEDCNARSRDGRGVTERVLEDRGMVQPPVGTASMPLSSALSLNVSGNDFHRDVDHAVGDAIFPESSLELGCGAEFRDVQSESLAKDRACAPVSSKSAETAIFSAAAPSPGDSEKSAPERQTQTRRRKYPPELAEERRKMSNRRSAARSSKRKRERFLSLQKMVAEARLTHSAVTARHATLRVENETLRAALRLSACAAGRQFLGHPLGPRTRPSVLLSSLLLEERERSPASFCFPD